MHQSNNSNKQFILFSTIERSSGICWHFRRTGRCPRGESCTYEHIRSTTALHDDLYKKNNNSKCSSSNSDNNQLLVKKKEEPSSSEHHQQHHQLSCWITIMVKELKYPSSALRRTLEGNGFNILTTRDEFLNEKKNEDDGDNQFYLPLFWGHTFPKYNIVKWNELPSYTIINNFSNSHELCSKSLLALNFQELSEENIKSKSQFVPLSFYLPQQLNLFINYGKNQTSEEEEETIWIVKPGRSGEGRGIQIYKSYREVILQTFPKIPLSEIDNNVISDQSLKLASKHQMVVSKYISNPLLIENKKFDMRMYVLLIGGGSNRFRRGNSSSSDHGGDSNSDSDGHQEEEEEKEEFHTYFYQDAIVRFASEEYSSDLTSLRNPFIHITNNTINDKKNKIQNETVTERFGFFSNMYLPGLRDCLERMGIDWLVIEEQIKCLVRESLQFTVLNPQKQDETFHQTKSRCFQLYGYDVMIDSNLRPHLLEVNSMPDLSGATNSLVLKGDYELKSKLLANALNLVRLPSPGVGVTCIENTFDGGDMDTSDRSNNNLFVKI